LTDRPIRLAASSMSGSRCSGIRRVIREVPPLSSASGGGRPYAHRDLQHAGDRELPAEVVDVRREVHDVT
jgi:hypothetical protein